MLIILSFGIASLSNKPGVILTPWCQSRVKKQLADGTTSSWLTNKIAEKELKGLDGFYGIGIRRELQQCFSLFFCSSFFSDALKFLNPLPIKKDA